ncbi:uncharacterized protein LOC114439383 isoform X2 [Parambassis ranga]|uniref:Uncharacterized protein LOC114439383 isoform X2 n=1 Tax=Parambassis ranga TaxID=210632 RepID=A0A6P7INN2_9TELE|nr:uncharacterized protein LOC114439383 isoform X2 [Parambassis ranga]
MKRSFLKSASAGARDVKKFSKSEVQTLVKQEVRRAVRQNEAKLKGLMENIQQLDSGVICERAIRRLEARLEMVEKRSVAALAHMTRLQQQSRPASADGADLLRIHPKKEPTTQKEGGELFEMMATTKKSLKRLHEDNETLTAAIADLSQPPSPPPPAPHSPPDSKVGVIQDCLFVKEEPEQHQGHNERHYEGHHEGHNERHYEGHYEGCCDEPKPKKTKAELHIPAHTDTEQRELLYPPLPPTTFPSILSMEAAKHSIPQKPEVRLALIRNPTRLSVLWNVEKKDPSVAEMDSYTIYLTTEKVKGTCVFSDWMILGEVKAIELPMCVLVKKYKPGHKVCVAVVGKDVFARYGPYSKVSTAVMPETLG